MYIPFYGKIKIGLKNWQSWSGTTIWEICTKRKSGKGIWRKKTLNWWKTEVVPQPFAIALWLRSNFLNPSEIHPLVFTLVPRNSPLGMSHSLGCQRDIWTIGPTKCRSLSERPPDLSVPQCVAALSLRGETISWHSAEVTIATTYTSTLEVPSPSVKN